MAVKPIIWRPHLLPKHRFALWLFAHRKFLTKDRQPYILDRSCGLCGMVEENAHHLFFQCTYSTQLWLKLWTSLDVQCSVTSLGGLLRVIRRRFRGNGVHVRYCQSGIAAVVYHIWQARNRAIFDNERPDVEALFRKVLIHIHRSQAPD